MPNLIDGGSLAAVVGRIHAVVVPARVYTRTSVSREMSISILPLYTPAPLPPLLFPVSPESNRNITMSYDVITGIDVREVALVRNNIARKATRS